MSNGYTSHGHAIPGVAQTGPRPTKVARCGGPRLCQTCKTEAGQGNAGLTATVASVLQQHGLAAVESREDDPAGWGVGCVCGWRSVGNDTYDEAETNFNVHMAEKVAAVVPVQPIPNHEIRQAIVSYSYGLIARREILTVMGSEYGNHDMPIVPGHWQKRAEDEIRPLLDALGL